MLKSEEISYCFFFLCSLLSLAEVMFVIAISLCGKAQFLKVTVLVALVVRDNFLTN